MKVAYRAVFVCFATFAASTSFGADYVCRAVDIPGSTWTQAGQLNNAGQLVATSDAGSAVYSAGTWTFLPPIAGDSIAGSGINDSGVITGTAVDASGRQSGFVLNGNTYSFFQLEAQPGWFTQARTISNSGVVLGLSVDPSGFPSVGFRREPNGQWTAFAPQLADGTAPSFVSPGAMNDAGQFVGGALYFDPVRTSRGWWAFIYDPATAQFKLFRIGGVPVRARGINNSGAIAAFNIDGSGVATSWIHTNDGDQQISCSGISAPTGIYVESINDRGVIAGNWLDANSNPHGFLGYPDLTALFDDLINASTGIGPGKSLASKAKGAKADYVAADTAHACGLLADYVAEVHAQSGKTLTPAQATALETEAGTLMQALGCS